MNVVCHIRYEIDPFKQAQFEEYARVPAAGGSEMNAAARKADG